MPVLCGLEASHGSSLPPAAGAPPSPPAISLSTRKIALLSPMLDREPKSPNLNARSMQPLKEGGILLNVEIGAHDDSKWSHKALSCGPPC